LVAVGRSRLLLADRTRTVIPQRPYSSDRSDRLRRGASQCSSDLLAARAILCPTSARTLGPRPCREATHDRTARPRTKKEPADLDQDAARLVSKGSPARHVPLFHRARLAARPGGAFKQIVRLRPPDPQGHRGGDGPLGGQGRHRFVDPSDLLQHRSHDRDQDPCGHKRARLCRHPPESRGAGHTGASSNWPMPSGANMSRRSL